MSPDDRPRLSVVVIGRNEGPRLQRCLSSIEMIELPPDEVEVVYVDSGSTDGSVARAQEAGARVVEWPSDYATPGGARNRGWAAASAQYVLFLDADCRLEPDFPREALTEFDDPKVAIVFGIIRERKPDESIYTQVFEHDWVRPAVRGPMAYSAGVALVRSSALEASGGFDEKLMAAEEPELCRRLIAGGWIVLGIPAPMAVHELGIRTFRAYWIRLVRRGYGNAQAKDSLGSGHALVRELRRSGLAVASFAGAGLGLWLFPRADLLFMFMALVFVAVAAPASRALRRGAAVDLAFAYGCHRVFRLLPIAWGAGLQAWDRFAGTQRPTIRYKERARPFPSAAA